MSKKLLWFAFVLACVLGVYANAEGNVAKIGKVEYPTLQAAVDAAKPGDEIDQISDVYLTEYVTTASDDNIIYDLNGYQITVSSTGGRSLYAIYNYGTMTLKDSSEDKTGKIIARGLQNFGQMSFISGTIESCDSNGGGAAVWNEGDFKMTGGTLRFTGKKDGNNSGLPFNNQATGKAEITGGSLESPYSCIFNSGELTVKNLKLENSTSYWNCIKLFDGTANIENVTINSTCGGAVEAAGGIANLKNCHFIQNGMYDHNSMFIAASGGTGTANVYGGTFESANYGFYIYNSGGTINLYGDIKANANTMFKADNAYPGTRQSVINVYSGNYEGNVSIDSNSELKVSAGIFSSDITKYVADDSKCFLEEDGTYSVAEKNAAALEEVIDTENDTTADGKTFAEVMADKGFAVEEGTTARVDAMTLTSVDANKIYMDYAFGNTPYTVSFDIPNVEAGDVKIGVILYNIPENITVSKPAVYVR